MNEILDFVDSLPPQVQASLLKFAQESRYQLRDIQQYFKEEFDVHFSVILISDWLKESLPISEKIRYLQSITNDAQGIQIQDGLRYLFMRGLHLSIVLMDRLELDLPEDSKEIGKLAKDLLQETTRLGKTVEEINNNKIRDIVLGTATEVVELMEGNFKDTNYEEVYKQSAYNTLKLIESRQK